MFFCNWFLQSVHHGEVDPRLVFFCDEAWFSLRGEVNFQNSRCWSAENSDIHKLRLHDKKIGVWSAMSARREISTISGEEPQRVNNNVFRSCAECIRS
jgi:hypothetical protein